MTETAIYCPGNRMNKAKWDEPLLATIRPLANVYVSATPPETSGGSGVGVFELGLAEPPPHDDGERGEQDQGRDPADREEDRGLVGVEHRVAERRAALRAGQGLAAGQDREDDERDDRDPPDQQRPVPQDD